MASRQPTITGVNLGGWLVLEPWMTPSLFAGTGALDEYTYCLRATTAQKQALRQFRDNFITEQDFIWLAAHGVEAVRLPIGYWLFGQQGPYSKTYHYVDMVFKWADRHGLRVLLDFHGAPGSQNGKMHSGQIGSAAWVGDPVNQALTLEVLERLARRYGQQPALLGISLLNEPTPKVATPLYEAFYQAAVDVMRSHCRSDVWFVFSDNFKPRRWRHRLPGLHMDYHHYQLFMDKDRRLAVWAQLLRAHYLLPGKIRRLARQHPLVVGEWSMVLRASATVGQRRRYADYQQRAFAGRADAWFYWNYKTERGGPWSFRHSVEADQLVITHGSR